MALKFFENAMAGDMTPHPNRMYRDLNQAFINQQWENTTAKTVIKEQDADRTGVFESFSFHDVEVWLNDVVGQTSSGLKNGDDYVQLTFKSLAHECIKGRYYYFDDNYWISYYTNNYDGVVQSLAVRRCNNFLKIVDSKNGAVYSVPCVVGYDMGSPAPQISKYIITPNNHATVMVQGNKDTLRLFKLNTRYILGGRPFKLTGFQNAIFDNLLNQEPTILYLDMYLDEIHSGDNLALQLANNGSYNYSIKINSKDMELANLASGKLTADVLLNGNEESRAILWTSSNPDVVSIDANGNYKALGEVNQTAIIKAYLAGNELVNDTIKVKIVDQTDIAPCVEIVPDFNSIREYETIKFKVHAHYNGQIYENISDTHVSLSEDSVVNSNNYLIIEKIDDNYFITCLAISQEPIKLYITVNNNNPKFKTTEIKSIKTVSMLG